jgi:dTDP-4-dehydrorhamnose reductase
MKILILGKTGQLGWELQSSMRSLGDVISYDYPQINLIHPEQTCQLIRENQPDLVVNATAYTQVDLAEKEPDIAMTINGVAPGLLAQTAKEIHAAFVHFSTDYVFDGTKGSAYTEVDAPNPLNVYGKTKLTGEASVREAGGASMILRTSWLYSTRRDSFVTKVIQWGRENTFLRIVSDQIGSPTWARSLAEVTAQMVAEGGNQIYQWVGDHSGIYHLGGSGCASRYEWAKLVLKYDPHRELLKAKKIIPASTAEFPTPAVRPANTCLDCSLFFRQFHLCLPDWETSLKLALEEL